MELKRFEVYLVILDPTISREIKKTKACLVIPPEEMKHSILTIIVAPTTIKSRRCPTRVICKFNGKFGEIVLHQIRTIAKQRLVKILGAIDPAIQNKALSILQETLSL